MIILDTNVISALVLPRPNQRVVDWLDRQPASTIWTTTVTVYELYRGIATMEEGRRRNELTAAVAEILGVGLHGRIMPFDMQAAHEAARLWAARCAMGRPVHVEDNQIAGIARLRGAAIATRDTADFSGCGVQLINPWND